MSEVDDYLSDAFLVEATGSKEPISYSDRRKQARRDSERKNLENRKRSRKELETSTLQEGLRKSLFERARDEEGTTTTASSSNKAMNMMLKMGFQIGQPLGRADEGPSFSSGDGSKSNAHRTEPIPVHIWSGKEGLGRKKRAVSGTPDSTDQENQQQKHDDFRQRSQKMYEERRAEGRLHSAMKTLRALDEGLGIEDNYLSLDPTDKQSFPPGWLLALGSDIGSIVQGSDHSRLRVQMRADRLVSTKPDDSDDDIDTIVEELDPVTLDPEQRDNVLRYLGLSPTNRLTEVLDYLRTKHLYCFWCGARYKNKKEMEEQCPGIEESEHD